MIADTAEPIALALSDLVRGRRSARAFRDQGVSRQIVAELLLDTIWAPSPHNSQPWRFTGLFEDGDKQRLADAMAEQLASELRADGLPTEIIERQTSRSRGRISTAPVVLLCSLQGDGLVEYADQRRNQLEWQMAVQSVGAALQTLFLLAAQRGIGACWMAAPMYCPEVVRRVLDLPAEFVPQALVLMGYPAGAGKVRERRPFEQVVDLR